jgi:dynein light intermediate chain 1
LIYTSIGAISPLQALIYSSLGIQSLLKKQPLKHNVIDRDRILVPPNWDSWGKVRVLRDGFDVEAVSDGWSIEIDEPIQALNGDSSNTKHATPKTEGVKDEEGLEKEGPAISIYESVIKSPHNQSEYPFRERKDKGIEVESLDPQEFLASQLKVLQQLTAEDDPAGNGNDSRQGLPSRQTSYQIQESERDGKTGEASDAVGTRVNEHIGPVQFNVGGIQVDADDMLKKLKVSLLR